MEEEETNLTPAQIRRKAVATLLLGVVLCTVFSDPMVDVLAEIAAKSGVPAFYVAFVIAPMISNASEIISSVMQAAKKRRANIDVTYSQLIGAATMNVRFCVRAVALRPLPHFLPSPCSLLPRPTTLRRRTRFASAFSSSLCLFGASRGSFPQRCFPFWSSSYSWRCLFSPARTRCSRCGKRLLRVCCSRCPSSLCLCWKTSSDGTKTGHPATKKKTRGTPGNRKKIHWTRGERHRGRGGNEQKGIFLRFRCA